jgi:hypothetical protein
VRSWRIVPGLQLVRLSGGTTPGEAARRYRQDRNVLYVEPNYTLHAFATPNDPYFPQMWNLQNTGQGGGIAGADIHATQAWNLTTGSSSVVVAVIDTGADYNHPDLAQNMWTAAAPFSAFDINGNPITCPTGSRGFNAIYGLCDAMDDNGHGTHVSGTIGSVGNNQLGVVGVNWQVQVLPCKFLGPEGLGDTAGAIECLEVIKSLKDSGINIVATNNSWGGGIYSQALYDAIAANLSDGILFVAAAGNDFSDNDVVPVYPADYSLPNVLAVAATTRTDTVAGFSNLGQHTVHLGAPGEDILSTTPNSTYSFLSGTSMATPHVTGVAALLAAQDPSRDWRAIKNLLMAGGDSKSALSKTITGKRLNAYGSMTCTNSAIYSRLRTALSVISAAVGQPTVLTALNINCAHPAGALSVTVNPGNQTIPLLDDGSGSDMAAGDGVYSGSWTPVAWGSYTLTFPGGDVIRASVLQNYGAIAQNSSNYRTFTGTSLNLGDDDVGTVTSPFSIPFGGGSFSQVYVSSNGTLSFTNAYGEYANDALPLESGFFRPQDVAVLTLVAPFWDDLYPVKGTNQNVFWQVTGTAPNRELMVEWRDVRAFECRNDPAATVKFQVVFEENSGNVSFNYADTVWGGNCAFKDAGGSATAGIQVAPGLGSLWSYNQQLVSNGTSLLWQTPPPGPANNPVPSLTSLSPNSVVLGGPSFTLTLTGTNFVADSNIIFGGNTRAATYVSSTQLQAQISADDINLYKGAGQIQVTVVNPSPGGGTSNAVPFTFQSPGPTISALSPASALAGGFGFVLTVSGSNFSEGAQVQWNGQSRQTFVQNPNLLTAAISDSDLAAAGTAKVTVVNPSPGGGASNTVNFVIASRGAPGQNLAIQPGGTPFPGTPYPPLNKPVRFLGWNLAPRLGAEYLRYFNRPRANLALPVANPTQAESSPSAASSAAPPPLPGFAFRDSLPADFTPSGVAAGDFNRDGHMDWVVANGGRNTLWVYLGNGDGTSRLPIIYPLSGQSPVAVAVADLRGNGKLDLVVAEADSGTVGVLLGNGDGTFGAEKEHYVPGPPLTLAVTDLNKDGHPDVVVGTIASDQVNGFISLFGDGTGALGRPISRPPDDIFKGAFVLQMSVADFDHDGLPDIVYAEPSGDTEAWTFINQGDGTFKRSQLLIFGFPMGGVFVIGSATGDLNSDGCPDAAVLFSNGMAFAYNGDCSGLFKTISFATNGLGDTPIMGAIADVDGDGRADLVTAGIFILFDTQYGRVAGNLISVLLNDGNGGLQVPKVYRGDVSMYSFALSDINGDGKLDVVSANQDSDSVSVFLNDGKGGFGSPEGGYLGYLTPGSLGGASNAPWSDFLVSDLNGDGYPDLGVILLPQWWASPWKLATLLNDKTGHFGPPQSIDILNTNGYPWDFVFADFRKTGKPDFLELGSTTDGVPEMVYAKNKGDGTFAYPTVTAPSAAQGVIAVGDFNADGNLDFVAAAGQGNSFTLALFLGHGNGTFTQGSSLGIAPPGGSSQIFTGDFNHDGKLDVLVSYFGNGIGQPHPLYEILGNGDGTFQLPKLLFSDFQALAVADLNQDGLPDIVELDVPPGVWGTPVPLVFRIYLGQPDGSFLLTNTYQPYSGNFEPDFVGPSPLRRFVPMLADFNGDGNLDIAAFQSPGTARNFPNDYFQVLLGNGDGTFTPSYTVFPNGKPGAPSTAADVNRDGRADLIELDSLPSSFHVIPAVAGPSFQVRLVSDPVVGGAGILRITLALAAASAKTLQLSASDAAITISPSVTIAAGNFSQDVAFQIGPGFNMNHVFAIQVQSGAEVHTAYGTMANPSLPIGFALSAGAPSSPVTVPGGTLDGFAMNVTSIAGYAAVLNPTCQGLPPGARCNFTVAPIDLSAGGHSYQYFSLTAPNSIAVGDYPFQVQVTDGNLTQTVSTHFKVGDFTLSLSVGAMATLPTTKVFFDVSSSPINDFSGAVTLTCQTPHSSIACKVISSPIYVPGDTTIEVDTDHTPLNVYPITITGSVGSVSHSVTEQLTVGDVSSSISPTSATIPVGAEATFAVSISSQGGFSGALTYSCMNGAAVVACMFDPSSGNLAPNGSTSTTLTMRVQGKPARRQSSINWVPIFVPVLAVVAFGLRKSQRAGQTQHRTTHLAGLLVLVLAIAPGLVSCGGGGGGQGPPPPPPPSTTKVTVQATSGSITFTVGTITVTVP